MAIGADIERVVQRENTHAMYRRTFGTIRYRRNFAKYSVMHMGRPGDSSALHRLTVNDVF